MCSFQVGEVCFKAEGWSVQVGVLCGEVFGEVCGEVCGE